MANDTLYCKNNNLMSLAKLNKKLKNINVENNKITLMPVFTFCNNITANIAGNPIELFQIYDFEKFKHFFRINYWLMNLPSLDKFHMKSYSQKNDENYRKAFDYQINYMKKYVKKIENWFLECKYNPKYKFCRKRLILEYEELYEINK